MDKNLEISLHEGQCGLCIHFSEHHKEAMPEVTQIRRKKKASKDVVAECGHPAHAPLHLKVNVASGCDGFSPAH